MELGYDSLDITLETLLVSSWFLDVSGQLPPDPQTLNLPSCLNLFPPHTLLRLPLKPLLLLLEQPPPCPITLEPPPDPFLPLDFAYQFLNLSTPSLTAVCCLCLPSWLPFYTGSPVTDIVANQLSNSSTNDSVCWWGATPLIALEVPQVLVCTLPPTPCELRPMLCSVISLTQPLLCAP